MTRWPIIRHIRWLYLSWRVARHYAIWRSLGYLAVRADEDRKALDAVWRGEA